MFEHGLMGRVCAAKREQLNTFFSTHPSAGPEVEVLKHLQLVARTFVQMLQDRQKADYDNAVR